MIANDDLLEVLGTGFKTFVFDNFLSTEKLVEAVTGTGTGIPHLCNFKLSTGVLQNSTIKERYDWNLFNINYSKAIVHLQMNKVENLFGFIGFKESVNDPISIIRENHAGIIIEMVAGIPKMFWSTGYYKGTKQITQKVEIDGFDLTKDNIIRIENQKLYTYPFPYFIPYMDSFKLIKPDRIWTLRQSNDTARPDDTAYYFVVYLKNLTGEDCVLTLKKFIYGENYAD